MSDTSESLSGARGSSTDRPGETRLALSRDDKAFLWLIGGIGGAALGLLLMPAGRLADGHSFPNADLIEFLGSFGGPLMDIGRPVIFALIGLGIVFVIIYDSPDLRITDEQITISEGDDIRVIAREQVGGVYRRKRKVVIESAGGRTLFTGEVEGGKEAIGAAFTAHRYPWEGR